MLFTWLRAQAGTLELTLLDVGQGDAILLQGPDGKTVLIDAGPRGASTIDKLRQRNITELNLVIATHAHADHIGGMLDVIEAMPPRLYVDQGMAHTSSTYEKLMTHVEDNGVPYRTGRAGQSFSLGDEVLIEILHPQDSLLGHTRSDLNANSIVTRITHDEVCFLLTGDAEAITEEVLLNKDIGTCQVLKVAHHGSGYSTSAAWLRTIEPEIALISAGRSNRYGHPDPETLARLESSGAQVYRTDLQGDILVQSDGKTITVVAQPAETLASISNEQSPVNAALTTIDVNNATAQELEGLPGIGPVKAAAIVEWRNAHGSFNALQDLDAVPGIGPATLAKISPVVVFGPSAPNAP